MFDTQKKLDISQEELAVIEAALHTQSKILGLQAGAGGTTARAQLNEVKRVLATLAQHHPKRRDRPCGGARWLGMSRIFG